MITCVYVCMQVCVCARQKDCLYIYIYQCIDDLNLEAAYKQESRGHVDFPPARPGLLNILAPTLPFSTQPAPKSSPIPGWLSS